MFPLSNHTLLVRFVAFPCSLGPVGSLFHVVFPHLTFLWKRIFIFEYRFELKGLDLKVTVIFRNPLKLSLV